MNEELSDQFLDFSMGNDSGWTSQKNSRSSSTDNVDVADSLRQYYHRDNITACVDAVTNLGDYLELEIIVDEEEKREAALDQLEQILHTLGYSMQDTTRTSYLSMFLKKKKK